MQGLKEINTNMSIDLPPASNFEELQLLLAIHINHLIQTNFQKLVFALYRIDVNEARLKQLLEQNPGEDSGKIIGELIIERQVQKIKSRQQFRQPDSDITEDEKW